MRSLNRTDYVGAIDSQSIELARLGDFELVASSRLEATDFKQPFRGPESRGGA